MNNDICEMKEQISKLINDNAFLEDKEFYQNKMKK